MAHAGYGTRRVKPGGFVGGAAIKGAGGLAVEKKPKPKGVSLKNQIRSAERMLRKVFPCIHQNYRPELAASFYVS